MRKRAFKLALFGALLMYCNQAPASNAGNLPIVTNFELVKGMVIVQAELDGKMANFILDTGAPMMILNGKETESSAFQANTLQGGMAGTWKNIGMFAWAGVRKFDLKALKTDISALEMVTNRPIAGLIGYEFLEDFELVIDFEHLLITLVSSGEIARLEGWTLKAELPFYFAGHLPVIEAKIGDRLLRFGLDTGANTNMLDFNKAKALDSELVTPISQAGIIGLTGDNYKTTVVDVVETSIGGLDFQNMRFVFSDISHLQNLMDNNVDGLLGFPFFKAGKFSFNYSRNTISIWE
ncbi:MAG: aspartyl protease family protein [Saprospiraceae bacterium]|nr:aspartyl protease family protein [Saprospiraceae bacterium]MCF8252471.1 aspartyl protease family protein [Saprospiraceae bacterium]MCF8282472.1 aspartyl protease family protein [Bacteroidales bacterium]MCF8312662.1 aspartyl protease family protein [Saprospiraceae bacterium]MCF8441072.1 aspartyl protease family protein [Saprospiraceae bacterium]